MRVCSSLLVIGTGGEPVSDLERSWLYVALVVSAEGLLITSCFQRRSASNFLQIGHILLASLILISILVSPNTWTSQGHFGREDCFGATHKKEQHFHGCLVRGGAIRLDHRGEFIYPSRPMCFELVVGPGL